MLCQLKRLQHFISMLRKIEVPKGFIEAIPPKLLSQLDLGMSNYKHTKILTNEEFYSYSRKSFNDPNGPKLLRSYNNQVFEVEFDGFVLVEEIKQTDSERLFELESKAKELDQLKKSLANIKTVIGDI